MEEFKPFEGDKKQMEGKIKKTENEKKEDKPKVRDIVAQESGYLVGATINEQLALSRAYLISGILPKRFTKPEQVLVAMQYCYEVGLKPLTGMRQLAIINGVPSFYGNLPLAIVRNSGKMEAIEEYFLDEKGERICEENHNLKAAIDGAVCITKRKDAAQTVKTWFTMADAERAKLLGKDCWKYYPKTMLKYRARGENLNDNFSDVLNGINIAEYHFNDLPKDENGVVEATTEEVKEHIDKTVTDYKIVLVHDINNLLQQLMAIDATVNEARVTHWLNEFNIPETKTFATEANLEGLKEKLNLQIEGRKAAKKREESNE